MVLQQRYGCMCGADCGETRAMGFPCCWVECRRIRGQQQQQGFIHHLVSYTQGATGYSAMKLSSSVERLVLNPSKWWSHVRSVYIHNTAGK